MGGSTVEIRWSQLGNPSKPGRYRVKGLGDVEVAAEDIADAEKIGGDPLFEVVETDTFQQPVKSYVLGYFRPGN
jgi:hypothetical protein